MVQTNIQKVFAILILGVIIVSNWGSVRATQIGTGSVVGDPSFDTPIIWDNNFPWTASGSVEDILIKARVLPSLNMEISDEEIDLGVLLPWVTASESLAIEIGTNAVNGVIITARSQSGWLTNVADNTIQINDLFADGVQESYTWASTPNATDDSSYWDFTASGLTELEVNDTTTEHVVYDTNRPEATDGLNDVIFTVTATAEAETPAGDYEDRVTFTVTGSF